MTETAPTLSLVMEREMPHPPQKIWRALTEGALLERWLMKNDFQPIIGHRFTFRLDPVPGWNGIIECEVKVVEPYSKLIYSWSTMGGMSEVIWTLTQTQTGTHVRMEQTGFPSKEHASYKGATYGWRNFLNNLERVAGEVD